MKRKIFSLFFITICCIVLFNVKSLATTDENNNNTQIIKNGIYVISTENNMVLDVTKDSKENCANIELWEKNGGNNQKFKLIYKDGYYTIECVNSGKYFDVYGNYKQKGTNVEQFDANGQDNQKWILKDAGNGYYYITSKSCNLNLDIFGGYFTNGTNVQVWTLANQNNQKFKFELVKLLDNNDVIKPKKTIEEGTYAIKSASNINYGLDVCKNSKDDGANVELWQYNATLNQKFNVKLLDDNYYVITNINSNKALDIYGDYKTKGANVQQKTENDNSDSQKWIIKDTGDGYYNIISKTSHLYLDIYGGYIKNGSNMQIWESNGLNNQKFKFEKVEVGEKTIDNGYYSIFPKSNNSLAFDVYGNLKSDGAKIELWTNNSQDNQNFKFTYVSDGFYNIIATNSNKALSVNKNQASAGASVEQQAFNSNDNAQKWIVKSLGNDEYSIISEYNGLYMDIYGGYIKAGTRIQTWTSNNLDNQKFTFKKNIEHYKSTYGNTGLTIAGDSRGGQLEYYKYGSGPNVFFATFCMHGFEDNWAHDGYELVNIANTFYNKLVSMNDYDLADKWTIYIMNCVNPDGVNYGTTNNGPGRTTLHSDIGHGIDLNRCWSTGFVPMYSERNYTGSSAFLAPEARYLRDFMSARKSNNGETVVVDLHGWTQQLIGDETLRNYYREQFPENTDTASYGKGYMINWARTNLNAKAALIELPTNNYSNSDVVSHNLTNRYINATLSMLRGIGSTSYSKKTLRKNIASSTKGNLIPNDLFEMSKEYDGKEIKTIKASYQYKVALAGIIKNSMPYYSEIDSIYNNFLKKSGIWISPNSREKFLQIVNDNTNNRFSIDTDGYLIENKKEKQNSTYSNKDVSKENENYQKLVEYINEDKNIVIDINSVDYGIDEVTGKIIEYPFEKLDETQTMDIIQNNENKIFILTNNLNNKLTDKEIFNDFIENIIEH